MLSAFVSFDLVEIVPLVFRIASTGHDLAQRWSELLRCKRHPLRHQAAKETLAFNTFKMRTVPAMKCVSHTAAAPRIRIRAAAVVSEL